MRPRTGGRIATPISRTQELLMIRDRRAGSSLKNIAKTLKTNEPRIKEILRWLGATRCQKKRNIDIPVTCPVCGKTRHSRYKIVCCSVSCASVLKAQKRGIHGARTFDEPWTKRNKHKLRAHKAVWKALKSGALNRLPCARCGCNNAHAHHEDYSKPLEVMWLCRKHHMERHRELDSFKNNRLVCANNA